MITTGWLALSAAFGASLTGVVVLAASERRTRASHARLAALLALEARSADRFATVARTVSTTNHVLANATMAALLQSELLESRLREADGSASEASHSAARVLSEVRRCATLVNEVKAALLAATPDVPPFAWRPVLERACARHRATLVVEQGAPHTVGFEGGDSGFERVLDALLRNAWEGDGDRGARVVEVEVRHAAGDGSALTIAVRDDGPGFRADRLAELPRLHWSTKGRAGVSLFEAARLATASGGELRLASGDGGGAVVELGLPVMHPRAQ